STARGSEDAPRRAARDVPNSSRRRPAHRLIATSYATSGADCPSSDTVVLVFMVASQNRLRRNLRNRGPGGPGICPAPEFATERRLLTTSGRRDRSAPERRCWVQRIGLGPTVEKNFVRLTRQFGASPSDDEDVIEPGELAGYRHAYEHALP